MTPTLTPTQARKIIVRHWPPRDMPYTLRHICWSGSFGGDEHQRKALVLIRERQALTSDPELALLHQHIAGARPGQAVVTRAAKRTVGGLAL
jgi:hypothetical protein